MPEKCLLRELKHKKLGRHASAPPRIFSSSYWVPHCSPGMERILSQSIQKRNLALQQINANWYAIGLMCVNENATQISP